MYSRLDARRRLRHDDDDRRRAHRGQDQGARAGEAASSRRRRREGKSASLLEQSRPNVFTMNVANVLPGDTIVGRAQIHRAARADRRRLRVRVSDRRRPAVLVEKREREAARRRHVRQDAVHARRAKRRRASSISPASSRPACRSRSSCRRRTRSYASHRGTGRAEIDARRRGAALDGNRDFILRYRLAGQKIAPGLLLYQGADENFFLLMAQPPQAVAPDELPPREYVFVARRLGIDERLSARHRQEADARSARACFARPTRSTSSSSRAARDVLAGVGSGDDAQPRRARCSSSAARTAAAARELLHASAARGGAAASAGRVAQRRAR